MTTLQPNEAAQRWAYWLAAAFSLASLFASAGARLPAFSIPDCFCFFSKHVDRCLFMQTERDAPELARTAPVPSADDASGHVRRLAAECSAAFTPKAGGGSSAGFSAGEKHASGEFEARLGRISPSPQTPVSIHAQRRGKVGGRQ